MAKYVLIEFDSDDDAKGFISTFPTVDDPQTTTVRILAVYQKPTQFCQCEEPDDKSVRGMKYGIWVCTKCRKPHKGIWQSPTNQLRPDEHIGRRRLQMSIVEPQPPTYEKKSDVKR